MVSLKKSWNLQRRPQKNFSKITRIFRGRICAKSYQKSEWENVFFLQKNSCLLSDLQRKILMIPFLGQFQFISLFLCGFRFLLYFFLPKNKNNKMFIFFFTLFFPASSNFFLYVFNLFFSFFSQHEIYCGEFSNKI